MRRAVLAIVVLCLAAAPVAARAQAMTDDELRAASYEAVFQAPLIADAAIARLRLRGEADVLPTLALALRYRGPTQILLDAVSALAGVTVLSWHELMLWLEARPDIRPHPSYREIKLDILARIDPEFLRFLGGARSLPANIDIRLEEIVWGGVRVDGIPALDDPALVAADAAGYLNDDDLVYGVEISGDARAYPLRIMGWHEMFNDVIGDVPVALAYCTLCGAAILYETHVEGRDAPLVFGSSGFLYRSNKLMFDRETDSLWNQFTGRPVSGPLQGSGIELKVRPVVTSTWAAWRARHPATKVLSVETGHNRDYGAGVVYSDYFSSPDLMFPARVGDESVAKRKDFVFGVRGVGAARAWPTAAFAKEPVINDAVGGRDIVLIGDAETRTVRAYDRAGHIFAATDDAETLHAADGDWRITEDALVGPDGARLDRISGHLSFWFAWNSYFGVDSTLYGVAE